MAGLPQALFLRDTSPPIMDLPLQDQELLDDLVAANRILAEHGVIDSYGHVSIRHPDNPKRFFLARAIAPETVERADILEYDLDGNAVDARGRDSVTERFIHSEVYRARPDVMAVVHNHSPSVIPFSVTGVPMRALFHMASFIGEGLPNFEIRKVKKGSDLLVRDAKLGAALAKTLGKKPAALMRGHADAGALALQRDHLPRCGGGDSLRDGTGLQTRLAALAREGAQSMSQDLCALTASELVEAFRKRTLSPVDVTRAVLERIERFNPVFNAFILVAADEAIEQAKASEARWMSGQAKGLLDGVPVSIKDLILTKGWPTLRGSKTIDAKGPWNDDAPATARLREHGAVLLGKTTTPEFGWKGVTDSPLTGITRNPWNKAKTPGGSSGGAAAAVAAGMAPLAVGTDGGGSIRIPCGFTGIFGIKPSFGRVPAWPLSPFGTVAHVGPMTRSVADAALMLNVLALPDARDWHALPHDPRDWRMALDQGIADLRIAYSPNLGYAKVDPEVAAIVKNAVRVFQDLGAKVEEKNPGFEDPAPIFMAHWFSGAAFLLKTIPKDN